MTGAPAYCEWGVRSNFSFLSGASHPEELVAGAQELGLAGLGIADVNSLAGVVRGHVVAKDVPGFAYRVGARLVFADDTPDILAYPVDREAYGRLCRLLSSGNLKSDKGSCTLVLDDLLAHAEGLLLAVLAPADLDAAAPLLPALLEKLHPRAAGLWLGAAPLYRGEDRARLNRLALLAERAGAPLLATNDVLYHHPGRRPLQDVLVCIREGLTLEEAGRRLEPNAERHLKSAAMMARLFRDHPRALAETLVLARRIDFHLGQLKYNYPEETVGNGETAQQTLARLTWEGAKKRYPQKIPYLVKRGVLRELALIAHKQYAPYFLTVQDLVRFAREERNILCQGRGSAANSMVCFCLGITEVEPVTGNLVFGRFLSTERDEPPDIDVDFEHSRREEVIEYLYDKYGLERTGITATVITYRARSALREVGKVFGLSMDTVAAINAMGWGSESRTLAADRLRAAGLDPETPTLKLAVALARELLGFPRHLSQHVGGFVITRDRLDHLIPIGNTAMEGRTMVEWNKDDLDALGILKVDVLALGMLTCLRRAITLLENHYGQTLTLADLHGDVQKPVYAMIQRADTIGVFQIESRAQMSMLPRLEPKEFYDLVIEVAIVRPGPIQGGMVHPYLKRRQDPKEVDYPSEALKAVLERTLGVPLFQEQAMQIAIVGAGFTPSEADSLRRAMASWRRSGKIPQFREKFLKGMERNGYSASFAERCFSQIEGFGEYGFPESHAASFALLVYASAWFKCFYPDIFLVALLNSQPMGFYAPAQLIADAIEHGVRVRQPDVNLSGPDSTLEPDAGIAQRLAPRHAEMAGHIRSANAVRLGLDRVKGLGSAEAERILARRGNGYDSVRAFHLRTGLPLKTLETLARADAFSSIHAERREALWAVGGLKGAEGAGTLELFAGADAGARTPEPPADLPAMPASAAVIADYRATALSLKGHPLSFLRAALEKKGARPAAALREAQTGDTVWIGGLVLVRQRPGTASGVVFLTLEDETGQANVVVWRKTFEKYRRAIIAGRVLAVGGVVEREKSVVHLVARRLYDLTPWLRALDEQESARAGPPPAAAVMPGGRNFH